MEKLKKERSLLKDALKDIEAELRELRASKNELAKQLEEDSTRLDFVKEQEIKLRSLISTSMKKENALLKRKNKAKEKISELSKKIEKVKSIGRELGEV